MTGSGRDLLKCYHDISLVGLRKVTKAVGSMPRFEARVL